MLETASVELIRFMKANLILYLSTIQRIRMASGQHRVLTLSAKLAAALIACSRLPAPLMSAIPSRMLATMAMIVSFVILRMALGPASATHLPSFLAAVSAASASSPAQLPSVRAKNLVCKKSLCMYGDGAG